MKKIVDYLTETVIGKIITVIIPSFIFYYGLFGFDFKNLKINKMEIGLTIIFALIIVGIIYLRDKINYLSVKTKCYDIMINKMKKTDIYSF